jgi:hypothetical protein
MWTVKDPAVAHPQCPAKAPTAPSGYAIEMVSDLGPSHSPRPGIVPSPWTNGYHSSGAVVSGETGYEHFCKVRSRDRNQCCYKIVEWEACWLTTRCIPCLDMANATHPLSESAYVLTDCDRSTSLDNAMELHRVHQKINSGSWFGSSSDSGGVGEMQCQLFLRLLRSLPWHSTEESWKKIGGMG